jgi:ankyrin repeat protein
MQIKSLFKLQMVIAIAASALLVSGCWSAHPHSTYQSIHQYAISGDAAGVTAELTKSPDEVNLPEDDGLTPLHLAAENCHTNVVVLLLKRGAKVNIQANDNETPLHLAAQEGCADVVEILLINGAKVNARDKQGRTPLDRAQQWHQTNIVKLLQQCGGVQ